MDDPSLPTSPEDIDAAYLEPLLASHLLLDAVDISRIDLAPLGKGTSGDQLVSVTVRLVRHPNLRLILKLSRPENTTEAHFYLDLAGRIPIDTPRVLDARILPDRRACWILMEEIGARDGLSWSPDDYRDVLHDMARLHARYWSRSAEIDDCSWLWRPTCEAVHDVVAALIEQTSIIEGSWLPPALPDLFAPGRLARMRHVLERYDRFVEPLLGAGTSFVHGDYWFHNVLISNDGHRRLIDWQSCRIWSGIWELAYFINLLQPVARDRYRPPPFPQERLVAWYREGLDLAGVALAVEAFDDAFLCARILQPLLHWLPQFARSAAAPAPHAPPLEGAARDFFIETFRQWDEDVTRRIGSQP